MEWIRKAAIVTCVDDLKFSGLLNHTSKWTFPTSAFFSHSVFMHFIPFTH